MKSEKRTKIQRRFNSILRELDVLRHELVCENLRRSAAHIASAHFSVLEASSTHNVHQRERQ